MLQYLAWVFFVMGTINIIAASIRYNKGGLPTFTGGLRETFSALYILSFIALCFDLWWLWK